MDLCLAISLQRLPHHVCQSRQAVPHRARPDTFSQRKQWKQRTHQSSPHTEKTPKTTFRHWLFLLVGWILFLGRVGRRPQIRTLNLTSTLPSLIMYTHNNLIFHDSLNETQLNYFTCEFNCECWRTTILHSHNELFTDFCCNRRSVTSRRTWRPLQNTVNPGVVTKIWCTWFRNNLCSILRFFPKNKNQVVCDSCVRAEFWWPS